jgi:glycosyltransferase involved in cell wall biosynthesis
MKILEVYNNFIPTIGGVEKHIYYLAKCLKEKGDTPFVLSWDCTRPSLQVIDGILVYRIKMPKLFLLLRYPFILYLALIIILLSRKLKIDIVHAHDYLNGVAATVASIFTKKPVVVTFHLPIQKTSWISEKIKPGIIVEWPIQQFFILKCNAIICVSEYTLKESLKLFKIKHKDKFIVIRNWIPYYNHTNLNNKKFSIMNHLLFKNYILTVGRISEAHKRFSLIIIALKLLREKGYDLNLVIVGGGGPDKSFYIRLSQKLYVKENVYLLTNLPDEQLRQLYRNCEIFVLPSLYEGLPLVLLEASQFSKPLIATSVGGIPEIVKDGYNGFVIPPNDVKRLVKAIEILHNNPDLRRVFGERSLSIFNERFSERNCLRTIILLRHLLSES